STMELEARPLYRRLKPAIRSILHSIEVGDFSSGATAASSRYRFLAWNIERGIELERQLAAFRAHEYLRSCDVVLLTECDVGMAPSGNRAVAQTLARDLGLHYAFAPCYLNLSKGSGVERHIEGDNELGLHGNAVLSGYPIAGVKAIPLTNGIDKMATQEKRLGQQTAPAAETQLPKFRLTARCVYLRAHATARSP